MKTNFAINETLNELLLKVLSGVDYVSKIALATHKSIPVVYRQLDVLTSMGILSKQRDGKKVTYGVDWMNLSDIISSTLFLDFKRLKEVTNTKETSRKIVSEIKALTKAMPKKILENQKELNKLVLNFFKDDNAVSFLHKFLARVEYAGKDFADYNKVPFNKSIDMFLDVMGMLPKTKQEELLGKNTTQKNKIFLSYCRLRHLQKQLADPRNEFVL